MRKSIFFAVCIFSLVTVIYIAVSFAYVEVSADAWGSVYSTSSEAHAAVASGGDVEDGWYDIYAQAIQGGYVRSNWGTYYGSIDRQVNEYWYGSTTNAHPSSMGYIYGYDYNSNFYIMQDYYSHCSTPITLMFGHFRCRSNAE